MHSLRSVKAEDGRLDRPGKEEEGPASLMDVLVKIRSKVGDSCPGTRIGLACQRKRPWQKRAVFHQKGSRLDYVHDGLPSRSRASVNSAVTEIDFLIIGDI